MSDRPERQHEQPRHPGPRFSVVVPTYDRPAQLAACVAALRELERPAGTHEIVIVNDGGRAPAADIAAGSGDASLEVRLLTQRNAGPAAARNAGAAAARGAWLAFTDDDCIPDPRWLVAIDAALRRQPDALAGGPVLNAIADDVYADASQRLAAFTTSWFAGGAEGRFFTSNNLAVSRDAFLDAGGFDARFRFAGEDREFTDRWSAQGRPSLLVEDAVVRHAHHLGARSFVRQHFSYGRGAIGFRRVRAAAGRPVRISLTFYVASIAFALRGGGGSIRALVRAALTVVAHASYVTGLLWERFSHRAPPRD